MSAVSIGELRYGLELKYWFPDNGDELDRLICRKYLNPPDIYKVVGFHVRRWETEIYLEGFEGVKFNSVMFSLPE